MKTKEEMGGLGVGIVGVIMAGHLADCTDPSALLLSSSQSDIMTSSMDSDSIQNKEDEGMMSPMTITSTESSGVSEADIDNDIGDESFAEDSSSEWEDIDEEEEDDDEDICIVFQPGPDSGDDDLCIVFQGSDDEEGEEEDDEDEEDDDDDDEFCIVFEASNENQSQASCSSSKYPNGLGLSLSVCSIKTSDVCDGMESKLSKASKSLMGHKGSQGLSKIINRVSKCHSRLRRAGRSQKNSNSQPSGASKSKPSETCKQNIKTKKVHFNEKHLEEVFEFEDDEESKQMRKLYWETFALDRSRFKDRIDRYKECLSSVLDPAHREKIYRERIAQPLVVQEDTKDLVMIMDTEEDVSHTPTITNNINVPVCAEIPYAEDQCSKSRCRGRSKRKHKSKSSAIQ